MLRILLYLFCFFVSTARITAIAQDAAKRYEIDAKRLGVATYEKDVLPRSREFIRLDSTYYVGHYYEGMYKYERAADYLGFKNCITPLKKALLLYEKDFGKDFSRSDIEYHQPELKNFKRSIFWFTSINLTTFTVKSYCTWPRVVPK